jgi:beta-N-acetylhexosaminidase
MPMDLDADALLGEMTLDEKVGQLLLLAFEADRLDAAEILFERYHVGGSYLSNDNLPDPVAAARMTERIQELAGRTRLAIPVLLGADQEGAWSVMYPDSCPGPGNMALGATGEPEHAREMYTVIGEEVRAVGLHASFAPCADCNRDPRNAAIGTRSFGERPELVAAMTAAAVDGMLAAGAIPTLKHYPGHGDTSVDSHRGLPTVSRSRDDLFATDLLPFARGVEAGAPLVMSAHILFPALDPDRPATLSPVILDGILRSELGFTGVVISDSLNMASMRANYDPLDAAISAIQAGVDTLMLAEEHYDHDRGYLERQTALIEGLREAVRAGRLPETRVDEAVGRVLRLKSRVDMRAPTAPTSVGSAAHREVELRAARAAVTVLRRSGPLVPVAPDAPLTLVNTTLRDAYAILGGTRGIGPNQTDAAFDLFVAAVRRRSANIRVLSAEEILAGATTMAEGLVVAVTENHPLPGADFDQSAKSDVLQALTANDDAVQVVALRDPYELATLPFVSDYLCTFGSRWCSAEAAAEVLFGQVEPSGASPVSVPGTAIEAR